MKLQPFLALHITVSMILGCCGAAPSASGESAASPRLKSEPLTLSSFFEMSAASYERTESGPSQLQQEYPAVKRHVDVAVTDVSIGGR